MSPWTYGNIRLTKRLSSGRRFPASSKPPGNAVICFVKDQGAKHSRPIIISTKQREGTYAQNKPPAEGGGGCAEGWERAASEPRSSLSSRQHLFLCCYRVCVMQQSKGLITVGRLSPLETQLLTIYKSNVPQTSETFGAATWGGFQESRHGALLQQEDKSPFWPPIFIFPSPSLSFSRGQINDLQLWMLPCLFLYFFLPKKPRIVKAACANENINI